MRHPRSCPDPMDQDRAPSVCVSARSPENAKEEPTAHWLCAFFTGTARPKRSPLRLVADLHRLEAPAIRGQDTPLYDVAAAVAIVAVVIAVTGHVVVVVVVIIVGAVAQAETDGSGGNRESAMPETGMEAAAEAVDGKAAA